MASSPGSDAASPKSPSKLSAFLPKSPALLSPKAAAGGSPRGSTASSSGLTAKLQIPGAGTVKPGGSSPSAGWKGVRGSMLMGGLGRGASFFAEKQAVVLNFGHSYTKVGLAAESRPRAIFKTPELGRSFRPII
eukprot:s75_g5.t1